MAWYHWIAIYLIIIVGVLFYVLPALHIYLIAGMIVAILLAFLMFRFLPPKGDDF